MNLLKNNYIYYPIVSLLSICTIAFIVCAILVKPVGCDSSYYLSCAEYIREGLTPYADFSLGYTPLFVYIIAGVKDLFDIEVNYSFDLLVWNIFFVCNIILVYFITAIIVKKQRLSILSALLYAFLSMRCEGLSVLLEVPSVTFGLLSVFCLLKYSQKSILVIIAGSFAFCSFFTKQYGIGYFLLMIFALCLHKQFKNIVFYILGFIIAGVIAVCLVGTDCLNIFISTSYSGYNEANATNTIFTPVVKYGEAILSLFRIAPVLLVPVGVGCYITFKRHLKYNDSTKLFVVLCCGVLGYLLQFIFAPYHHYYQYLLPFVAVSSIWIIKKVDSKYIYGLWFGLLSMTFVFSLFRISYNGLYINWERKTRDQQIELASSIKRCIRDKSSTLFIKEGSLMPQYYLTGYKPADRSYSFGNLSEEYYLKTMDMSDYLLIENPSDMLNTPLIICKIKNDFSAVKIDSDNVSLFKNKNIK